VAGGDPVAITGHVAGGGRARITTPGGAQFYRSAERLAR
jgi:urease accessory protein UreH